MESIKIKIALLSVFTLVLVTVQAQDIHFSAMDYSPMTMNPAMAGAKYDLQATANYRTQWNSVGTPYQTIAAGYDMRFGNKDKHGKGFLAAGINFNNDNAGENRVASNNIGLSVAYHLKLDTEHRLGLGIQGGFGQRSITNDGQWGNQYNGSFYDQNLASGETFNNANFNFFDVGAGLVYSYRPEQKSRNNNGTQLNIGVAAYHLNQPSFSFIKEGGENLYVRWSGFVMAEIGINDKKMAVEPQLIAQFQGPSVETLLGLDYRFFLGQGTSSNGYYDGTSLAVGVFYRNQDALISRFSVRFGAIDAGLVYDFNVFSSLKDVSRGRGGVEVFLRYIMNNPFVKTRARI
ncbi:MAG: PorP/SprF family type IX secretion system membrane protein [Brumimicrobium sp.]